MARVDRSRPIEETWEALAVRLAPLKSLHASQVVTSFGLMHAVQSLIAVLQSLLLAGSGEGRQSQIPGHLRGKHRRDPASA